MTNYPNILFIMADQHHTGRLGCYGDPLVKTPNHDFIAEEGLRFSSAYCNSPICGPSRACFFSGRYVHQHGVFTNFGTAPERSAWMPGFFRSHGYTTAGIGKMHMGYEWIRSQLDYNRNENLFDSEPDSPYGQCGTHYIKHLRDNELLPLFDLLKQAGPGYPCYTTPLPEEATAEAWIGCETVEFLRNRDRSKPFFLHASFPRPHDPLYVPEPFASMYNPDDIKLPPNAQDNFKDKSANLRGIYRQLKEKHPFSYPYVATSPEDLRRVEAYYYGLISLNDKYIGIILDELRNQGIIDDTIIVFTADHGDFAGEHGMHFKNLGIYESIHRIPMMIRYPEKISPGQSTDLMFESVDLFPTLCELAGLDIPPNLSGNTILPALTDKESWTKSMSICELLGTICGVRTEDARMTFSNDDDSCELYDLASDPWEMNNIWKTDSRSGLKNRMIRELLEWYRRNMEKQTRNIIPPGSKIDNMIRALPACGGKLTPAEYCRKFG